MRANTAILTDAAKSVTAQIIGNYGSGVFQHITSDWGQHTQMLVYGDPYAVPTNTSVSAVVNVAIFKKYVDNRTSITFSLPAGNFTSPDIKFATQYHTNWHPFRLARFAADITGSIIVPSAGTYLFTLKSDDGSYLFIDGSLVINNGGEHPIRTKTASVSLTAGQHNFEVQFFENGGGSGDSGVDLILPANVIYGNQNVVQKVVSFNSLRAQLTYDVAGIATDQAVLIPINPTGTSAITSSPPIIITQPANQTVVTGGIATFSVTAISDTQIQYQWFKNSVVMSGQTGSRLVLTSVTSANDAAAYKVSLTNTHGTTTSNAASLTVVAKSSAPTRTSGGGSSFNIFDPTSWF